MGPRSSRRLAHLQLPEGKRIFDVDGFLSREDLIFDPFNGPLIKDISSGRRNTEETPEDMAELEIYFWCEADDFEPIHTETVGLPKSWTSRMYLASLLRFFSMHRCLCIRTVTIENGPSQHSFRTISIVSSLFVCTRENLEDSLFVSMQMVQGGYIN